MRSQYINHLCQTCGFHLEQQTLRSHAGLLEPLPHFANGRNCPSGVQGDSVSNKLISRFRLQIQGRKKRSRKVLQILGNYGRCLSFQCCSNDMSIIRIWEACANLLERSIVCDHCFFERRCHGGTAFRSAHFSIFIATGRKNILQRIPGFIQHPLRPANAKELCLS